MAQIEEDWQSKCGTAKDRGHYLLQTGSWSDCKFLVGQHNKVYFSAHKLILASASRVFEAMFYGDLAETREIIDITDIQPEAFKAMLEYIYTDVIKLNTYEDACALYYCADKYYLKHLTEGCARFLLGKLKPENVCQIYEFAKMFNEQDLIDKAIQIIQAHTPEVLNSSTFIESKLTTVLDIFSHSILNLKSELELFDAAERYVNAFGDNSETKRSNNRKRKIQEDDSNKNENVTCEVIQDQENQPSTSEGITVTTTETNVEQQNNVVIDDKKKEIFRKIISKILFLTMSPQDFANSVSQSPYMTQNDCYGLIMNIVSDTTNVPVPPGFCTNRRPRYKLITETDSHVDHTQIKTSARPDAVFAVTVPNFKKYKQISQPFFVRNLKWRVAIDPQPNINDSRQMVLGIYLMALYPNKQTFACSAEVEIGIALLQKPNTHHVLKKMTHCFTMKSKSVGAMVPFNDPLFDLNHGCVRNNAISIIVKIKANEVVGI